MPAKLAPREPGCRRIWKCRRPNHMFCCEGFYVRLGAKQAIDRNNPIHINLLTYWQFKRINDRSQVGCVLDPCGMLDLKSKRRRRANRMG